MAYVQQFGLVFSRFLAKTNNSTTYLNMIEYVKSVLKITIIKVI